jgi:hypothetical protein
MKSVYDFVITPVGQRYNNVKKVGDKNLIVNSEIFNHQHVNRLAKVLAVPTVGKTDIKVGDEVIVHHNVFRRWHDVKGREKNSRSFIDEHTYVVSIDQIFLIKRNNKYTTPKGYCFVKPIKAIDKYNTDSERPLVGIVRYTDGTVDLGDLVGVRPNSKYEFIIEGERLYRVLSSFITIKYEYQGDEEEYNPSWA